jgi:starvation-inducible DNA-binding protein
MVSLTIQQGKGSDDPEYLMEKLITSRIIHPNKTSEEMATLKTFAKLGYSHLDTAEIVTSLNILLSNYAVFQQKLRNFHWNVKGQDFFDLHQLFEDMYKRASEETDDIAERIRLFGKIPVATFQKYLENSSIQEVNTQLTSFEMAKNILNDILQLIELMEEVITAAENINDNGTEHMIKSFTYKLEKDYWMLNSWTTES